MLAALRQVYQAQREPLVKVYLFHLLGIVLGFMKFSLNLRNTDMVFRVFDMTLVQHQIRYLG